MIRFQLVDSLAITASLQVLSAACQVQEIPMSLSKRTRPQSRMFADPAEITYYLTY